VAVSFAPPLAKSCGVAFDLGTKQSGWFINLLGESLISISKIYKTDFKYFKDACVRSFVLILTRNNGSELKTSAWGIISGGYVGLVCCYTLCDRLPALPDWLSGDCNTVVNDLGLHAVMKKEVMGVT
jgi:hypothetical protein